MALARALLAGLVLAAIATGRDAAADTLHGNAGASDALLRDKPLLARLEQGAMSKFRFSDAPVPLADATVRDGNGRPVSLRESRDKLRLLAFWASWCAPCRTEIPSLERLQRRLGTSGLEVIAISIDKSPEAARWALDSWGVRDLALHLDEGARSALALGVPGVPMTLLTDPEGREIGRLRGSAQWDSVEGILLIEAVLQRLIKVKTIPSAVVKD